MKPIRIPTLQHLARHWDNDPLVIKKRLLHLLENPPPYSYTPMQSILLDLVFNRTDLETAKKAMIRTEGRATFRDGCIQILILVSEHFAKLEPDYVIEVQGRYYPISRELQIPFHPLLMYRKNDKTVIPWFSFWAKDPLEGDSLSLFATLVDEMMHSHPDYEEVELEVLDFSAPKAKAPRILTITESSSIPRVSELQLNDMLKTFMTGFSAAQEEAARMPSTPKQRESTVAVDENQLRLLD